MHRAILRERLAIRSAYKVAESTFIKGGNNRIILATDGDFNMGRNQ